MESYPSTSVKLAGVSPISNTAEAVVAAFEARGAQVRNTEDLDDTFPKWTLSPPVGLAGVTEVVVEGFVRHLLRADYILASTADYERYIGLLDAEYGQSSRTSEGGCTYRWWESGRVSIRGEHCLGKSDSLRFFTTLQATNSTRLRRSWKQRNIARNQESELLIHGRNGQIRERDSFGNDPFPPEG